MGFLCYVPFCETNKKVLESRKLSRLRVLGRQKEKAESEKKNHSEDQNDPQNFEPVDTSEGSKSGLEVQVTQDVEPGNIVLSKPTPTKYLPADHVSVHKPPKGMFQIWKKILPRKKNGPFTEKHRICSRHFTRDCFFTETITVNGEKVLSQLRWVLKGNAFPSIFPKEIPSHMIHPLKLRKPPKDRSCCQPVPKKTNAKPKKVTPKVKAGVVNKGREIGAEFEIGEVEVGAEVEINLEEDSESLMSVSLVSCVEEKEDDFVTLEIYQPSDSESEQEHNAEPLEQDDFFDSPEPAEPENMSFPKIMEFINNREVRLPTSTWNFFIEKEKICIGHIRIAKDDIPVLDKSVVFKENGAAVLLINGQVKDRDIFFSALDDLNTFLSELEDKRVCSGSNITGHIEFHPNCPLLLIAHAGPQCFFCGTLTECKDSEEER